MRAADERSALAGSWHVLSTSEPTSLAALRLDSHGDLDARVAVDNEGARHLLVPTSLASRPWSQVDSPLKDAVRDLVFGPSSANYLDVRCTDPALFDVFDELVLDVLDAAADATDVGEAVDAALARWRALFRAVSGTGIGRERRFGLFAELLVLEAAVATSGPNAVRCWTGPSQQSHDFEMPNACIEVKAAGSSSQAITVHGFGQLEEHDGRPLHLLVYTLVESPDGRTLEQVITSIESVVGNGALREHLSRLGYVPPSSERLAVDRAFVVTVDARVPVLSDRTVDALPRSAVRRVEYDLSLCALERVKSDISTSAVIAAAVQ
ncbi:PD-(D/E)XK motif protein [Cellulosimicrobium aquatile]|uniref:PD-(D/E)XK motif protein n=1 Tax=Cellulosimicrobium aquatile TaxID=1612203 RepID=UPI001459202E|nr:PD-(D/E)XK motif protein [Cellulosimicrobium aquatile]